MAFQILVLLSGIGIGLFKRGSIWNVGNLKMRIWWTLPLAYLFQHLSVFYLSGTVYKLVVILSYLVMITFCLVNVRIQGIIWALGGTVSNFVAMCANGLRMPAYIPAIDKMAPQIVPLLQAGQYGKSIAMSEQTHLNFLGDIFAFNIHPASLLSIGDILFSIGLVVLIQYAMRMRIGSEGAVDGKYGA